MTGGKADCGSGDQRGVVWAGLVSLDGSTLDDEASNAAAFGRPGASRGRSAFPQLRFVSLENGTRFASEMAGYGTSEVG